MKELIYSRNAVYEVLRAKRRQVFSIDIAEGAQEKGKIEEALKEAEAALKANDKDEIEAKSAALATASQKIAEKMYAQSQQGGAEGASTDAGAGTKGAQQAADADADVVDAEFEEVKDNKKSA